MEPKDIANFLVSLLELPKSIEISSIVINRKII
jgi:NADP-dependent 3-hydroxy acid dehydrogenase YdfG